MKSKIAFLTLIFTYNCIAKWDFNYGTNLRSYPSIGGGLTSEIGYSIPLYGTPKTPLSGLIRPNIEFDTSAVVSHFDGNVTLYPLSFLAFGMGKKGMKSDYEDFTYYDCDEVRCKGNMNKVYSLAKIALAYSSVLTSYSYKHYNNEYDDPNSSSLPVGEYEFVLEVNPGEETQVQKTTFVGYKISEATIGIVSNKVEFLESDKNYFLNIGIYQFKWGPFKTVLGAGTLGSSDVTPGGVLVVKLTHQVLESLAIF